MDQKTDKKLYFANVLLIMSICIIFLFGYHYHVKSKKLSDLESKLENQATTSWPEDTTCFLTYKDTIN